MEFSSFRESQEYNNFGSVLFYGFEMKNATGIGEETLSDNPAELGVVTGLLTIACIFNLRATMLKIAAHPHLPTPAAGFAYICLSVAIFVAQNATEDLLKGSLHLENPRLKATFQFISNLVCFCIFSPFIIFSLVLLYVYRCTVKLALRIQLKEKFVGLLEGTDTVWAIENDSCKSVINVLATIEVAPNVSNADLLLKLRELAQRKLVGPDVRLDKLSCLRKKRYGYFYWERCDSVDITEHVRCLDTTDNECSHKEKSNEDYLKKILSKLCTQSLPQNDQASWEILVGKSHLRESFDQFKDMEEGLIFSGRIMNRKKSVGIPIIFRVHHTLGDGFALFKLLLGTIADSKDVAITLQKKEKETSSTEIFRDEMNQGDLTKLKLSLSKAELILRNNKNLLGASMPFSLMMSANIKESLEKYVATRFGKFVSFHEFGEAIFEFCVKKIRETRERLSNIIVLKLIHFAKLTSVLIGMPSSLIHQALRSMDNSALHGPKLSGEKIFSSFIEGDSGRNIDDKSLLSKIQEVKHATGTRFGDVILAALSASLHKYFKQIGEFAPKSLTVVLPSRMSILEENLRLDNGFSVGLLPLCISGSTEIQNSKNPTVLERLFDVARNSHNLRSRSDYLVNFWVMKWLSAVLPEVLLRPILESNSTLIFSNVPGPREVQILGQRLRNIVFWVPHRGTTGIGFSVLSYSGNLHLGLVVDKALTRNENLLVGILENTVQEIHNLHEIIFTSHFSKSLHNLATASTKIDPESCEQK